MEDMMFLILFVIDKGYRISQYNNNNSNMCVYSTLSDGHPLPPVRPAEKKRLNVSDAEPPPAMLTPDDVVVGRSSPETALQKCNS